MTNRFIILISLLLLFYISTNSFLDTFVFLLICISIFCVAFLPHYYFHGAPYVRTSTKHIDLMISLAQPNARDWMIDLGSGMGDIISKFSTVCAVTHGIEVHPVLFWISQYKLKGYTAKVFKKDLWKTDLSNYDIVTLYGIPNMMPQLERKLLNELKPGARVVSNKYTFPNWKHESVEDGVYLYIK